MKKIKLLFLSIALSSIFVFQPILVMANSGNTLLVTKEYLEDGSYFETIIESNENQRSTKTGSKTLTYKNADGDALWYATVNATFYYDGKTSSCISSSPSAGSYVSGWKILSTSSSRTGNTASATVTAGIYYAGVFVDSITVKVLLSCDKNGNLS